MLGFPTAYRGDYYYADYCCGMDPQDRPGYRLGRRVCERYRHPVDLKVGPDGALYYLSRGDGLVGRISYAAAEPPSITLQPVDRTVAVGQSATFTVSATGSAPLAYQWRRNGNPIAGATGSSHTVANPQLSDSGALFDVDRVEFAFGSATSDTAQLTVTQNSVPAAAITQPVVEPRTREASRSTTPAPATTSRTGPARQRLHLVGRPAP